MQNRKEDEKMNDDIKQKILSQLNIKLFNQNKIIEKARINFMNYRNEINTKLKNGDIKNIIEDFELEKQKEKSLKKIEKSKLILESQIEKIRNGIDIKPILNDEIEEVSLEKEDFDETFSENEKAVRFLKDSINNMIFTIENIEKKINDEYIEARIKLKEGNLQDAKKILRNKKQMEDYIIVLKENIKIYQAHKNDIM
jgi:hypothetical protein